MPNNECEEQLISIPLSHLPMGGGGLDGGFSHVNRAPGQSTSNSNERLHPLSQDDYQERQVQMAEKINVLRGSEPGGSLSNAIISEENRLIPTLSNANISVPQQRRTLRTILDKETFVVPSPQQMVPENRSVLRFVNVQPRAESTEEANWRRRCEKLNRENHDLHKVG